MNKDKETATAATPVGTAKQVQSFRLSDTTRLTIAEMARQSETSQGVIVEQAIEQYAKGFKKK